MKVGYARVSTQGQSLEGQIEQLKEAGCGKIFSEKASGANDEREALAEALEYIREGDTLVVTRLDRFGRSLKSLIEQINALASRGVEFKSLADAIDTSTPSGKLVFHMMGALAEFERNLIRERTKAGLERARARGRKGGRKQKLSSNQVRQAQIMAADPNNRICDIAEALGVSRSTLYRHIDKSVMETRHLLEAPGSDELLDRSSKGEGARVAGT